MVSRKKRSIAKKIDDAIPSTVDVNGADYRKFKEYWSRMANLNSYANIREYMTYLAFGVQHGMVSTSAGNTLSYIVSHNLMALAKEKGEATGLDDGTMDSILQRTGGEIVLTTEQMLELSRISNTRMQIKVLDKFTRENENIVEAESTQEIPALETRDYEDFF